VRRWLDWPSSLKAEYRVLRKGTSEWLTTIYICSSSPNARCSFLIPTMHAGQREIITYMPEIRSSVRSKARKGRAIALEHCRLFGAAHDHGRRIKRLEARGNCDATVVGQWRRTFDRRVPPAVGVVPDLAR
jgi:hypothetical protein